MRASLVMSLLSLSAVCLVSAPVRAEDRPAPQLQVTTSDTIKSNLENFKGRTVILRLGSNDEVAGIVSEVGEKAVHLTQLTGKEFYDAVVPLEKINALIVRAKG